MSEKIYTRKEAIERIKQYDKSYVLAENANTIKELKEAVSIADFEPIKTEFDDLRNEIINYSEACLIDIDKEHVGIYEECFYN